jgi:hypothetical protein
MKSGVIGLAEFNRKIEAWQDATRLRVELVAKAYVHEALNYILETSPQYSGDFAANWNVSLGTPNYTFKENALNSYKSIWGGSAGKPFKLHNEVFGKGSRPAIDYALSRANPVIASYRLGQKVFLTNAAEHDEYYAIKIENNTIKWRPINEGAGHIMARTLGRMKTKYTVITPALAAELIASAV